MIDNVKIHHYDLEKLFDKTSEKKRVFVDFIYAAKTWKHYRIVIFKAECNIHGLNPGYIVTNLTREPKLFFEEIYCAHG